MLSSPYHLSHHDLLLILIPLLILGLVFCTCWLTDYHLFWVLILGLVFCTCWLTDYHLFWVLILILGLILVQREGTHVVLYVLSHGLFRGATRVLTVVHLCRRRVASEEN